MRGEGAMTRTSGPNESYPWYGAYREAMLELETSKLRERIEIAQDRISLRLEEIAQEATSHLEEQRAIADAVQNLRVLSGISSGEG